jgi:hypothetical protein
MHITVYNTNLHILTMLFEFYSSKVLLFNNLILDVSEQTSFTISYKRAIITILRAVPFYLFFYYNYYFKIFDLIFQIRKCWVKKTSNRNLFLRACETE